MLSSDSDFLVPLLDVFHDRPAAGIATPLVATKMEGKELVWALGGSVNWRTAVVTRGHADMALVDLPTNEPFEVEIASGAAMLIKREVLLNVDWLDESFFLYYEETDWSLKLRKAGYEIVAAPYSVVWHKVSATLGTESPIVDYYMLRNHLRLISRHWSGDRRLFALSRTVLRNLATIAAYTAKSHRGQRIPNRNARLLALRDAALGRSGKMGIDVARFCSLN